jgi:ribosomal protein L29
MDTRKRRRAVAIGMAISVTVIGLCLFSVVREAGGGPDENIVRGEHLNAGGDAFSDRVVDELRKYYGKTISEKNTQASIIGVRDLVVGTHPANGKELFSTILQRAFPDYTGDIMETLDKMDRYNRWLEDNRERIARMTATERAAFLWEKRKELFGDDAERIWSGEMLATEARNAKVQDAIVMLNESGDLSIEEKADEYRHILHETYEGSPEEYILDQTHLLSKIFFSMDSVQDELKRMSPEERQAEIDRVRREMGLTEEQVESMARRDADNERRWETGLMYMEERERIVGESDGHEREERLRLLREEYFDDEAGTIELEEKDGFFRFKRPRIYGRN